MKSARLVDSINWLWWEVMVLTLENVEANIVIGKAGVQCAEVGVVDRLEDQTRSLALVGKVL
jgi:hypothetical protein